MCRKLFYLVSFVLVLGLVLTNVAKAADPDLLGHWKFDDGSGMTAYDPSGNGNDGTINGSPNLVPGVGGSVLEFDGVNDYVGTGKRLLDNMTKLTLSCWVAAGLGNKKNPAAGGSGVMDIDDIRLYWPTP